MTKEEAYQAMLEGKKVAHEYYDKNEYVFINTRGQFETEEGCIHGGITDEFWVIYQKWTTGWEVWNG